MALAIVALDFFLLGITQDTRACPKSRNGTKTEGGLGRHVNDRMEGRPWHLERRQDHCLANLHLTAWTAWNQAWQR